MDPRYKKYFDSLAENATVPAFALEYFDLLKNQYLALPPATVPAEMRARMDGIIKKGEDEPSKLRWSDIYGFDLLLIELLPFRDLVQKAYDMRTKYRSVAGQRDYETYLASRPPDLTLTRDAENPPEGGAAPQDLTSPPASPPDFSPPEPSEQQQQKPAQITAESLRADLRYLLGQFYLYYALLPYREGFRDEITRRARNLTYIFLGVFILTLFMASAEDYSVSGTRLFRIPSILIVVLTGVIGGCVSMLQRIQSAPAEGDAIFNLAALTNGWKGMSLSPLYGAVFAMLFYMLFVGGVIKGVVFPEIETPASFTTPTPTPPTAAPTPTPTAEAITTTPSPTPTPERPRSIFLRFSDFTFPKSGKDYALLIIWAFLAGFLERLVPDALNRLVTKNEVIEGKTP